ncbi:MAG: hypothetical protein Q9228_002013 [Teloschistes exilis]
MAKSWIESSSLSDAPQARVAGPGTFRASFPSVFFPEILRWRSLEGLGSAEETDAADVPSLLSSWTSNNQKESRYTDKSLSKVFSFSREVSLAWHVAETIFDLDGNESHGGSSWIDSDDVAGASLSFSSTTMVICEFVLIFSSAWAIFLGDERPLLEGLCLGLVFVGCISFTALYSGDMTLKGDETSEGKNKFEAS